MSSPEKTPLHAQVKLLAVCLLAEVTLCGFMNAVRLHFAAMTKELWDGASWFLLLSLACSLIAMNVVSMFAAVLAIARKLEYRRFAAFALPILLLATTFIAAICFFGKAQSSAAASLASFASALAVNRFVPGKIWPPETLK